MTSEKFVAQVRSMIVDQNTSIYRDIFKKHTPETAKDPYWQRALALYTALDSTNLKILLEIIRQTMVETTSDLLSVLDEGITFEGAHQDLSETTTQNSTKLNGGLQDLFIAEE